MRSVVGWPPAQAAPDRGHLRWGTPHRGQSVGSEAWQRVGDFFGGLVGSSFDPE